MTETKPPAARFRTKLGELYRGDSLDLMPALLSESVDLIFADPPFNLGKSYGSGMDDALPEQQYLEWSKRWIDECVRLLKPGGSFFLYNLPKWNLALGSHIGSRLTFRHWVAIEMTYTLPIAGRLYPSHYSLLYFCKGPRPNTFTPDRIAMATCPHCAEELKDYGGYKDKMNPCGISLTDVWKDIPPVRHQKFKRRDDGNELSIKLLDRVISMASKPGDVVFDPFGGSGTTYVVAEMKNRRWVGIELGPVDQIEARLALRNLEIEQTYLAEYRSELNALFPPAVLDERKKRGLWTPGNIPKGRPRVTLTNKVQQVEFVLQESAAGYAKGKAPGTRTKRTGTPPVRPTTAKSA